jgi:importin subunit alpha-6/7
LLMHSSPAVQRAAVCAVANIVSGNDLQAQFIINRNVLPCLLALLSSPEEYIRNRACLAISNITAGTEEQIQSVIDNNIIPPLIHLLANATFDIQKEAAWAFSNAAAYGSCAQIQFLVQQGCISPLCELLTTSDADVVSCVLFGLENILIESERADLEEIFVRICKADGVKKIEDLQQHERADVREQAAKLVGAYFLAPLKSKASKRRRRQ